MADDVTYKTLHSFADGVDIGNSTQLAGYIAGIPSPFIVQDSFEWQIDLYEFYSDTAPVVCDFDNTNAVVKLFVVLADVNGASETELDDQSTSLAQISSRYGRVTFVVQRTEILEALAGNDVYFIVRIDDTTNNVRRTARRRVTLELPNGDGAANIEASDLVQAMFSPDEVTIDATATGQTAVYRVPTGKKFIVLDGYTRCTAVSGSGTAHQAQWGENADTDQLTAAKQSNQSAVDNVDRYVFSGANVFDAGEVVEIGIPTASTYTTHTIKATVTGLLIDA